MSGADYGWITTFDFYDNPMLRHWDGESWAYVQSPIAALNAVAADAVYGGWAVGEGFVNLDSLAVWPAAPAAPLNGVALVAQDDAWAVGNGGVITHWIGTEWRSTASPTLQSLKAVAMVSMTDGWAVGDGGVILHYGASAADIVTAPRAGATPAVDGDLWEWQALHATHLDRTTAATITGSESNPSPADLSADLYSAWRPGLLYFAVAVTDDVLVGSNSARPWNDDAVELSLHVPATGETYQFTLGLDGRQYRDGYEIDTLKVVTQTVPGGWTMEVKIEAWVLDQYPFVDGQEYPFTFALWDDDTRSTPAQTHMIWRGAATNTLPADWGALALSSTVYDFPQPPGSTPTATPTATPTPTTTPTGTPTATPRGRRLHPPPRRQLPPPPPVTSPEAAWHDTNGDGIRDADEPGLVRVTIKLFRAGLQVGQATTGGDGAYRFAGLLPGAVHRD